MNHLGGRRRSINAQQIAASKEAVSVSAPVVVEQPVEQPEKYGPKQLCPHCGKVPARFFHVRACGKKK